MNRSTDEKTSVLSVIFLNFVKLFIVNPQMLKSKTNL